MAKPTSSSMIKAFKSHSVNFFEINFFVQITFMQLGFSPSNSQQVQFNTYLFSDTQKYLYRK